MGSNSLNLVDLLCLENQNCGSVTHQLQSLSFTQDSGEIVMNTLTRDFGVVGPQPLYVEAGRDIYRRLGEQASRLLALLQRYHAVSSQRHALGELTDAQLADVGISRTQAREESAKPFWR
jgi:uncharacterized protein YjiS (DUF1127 family)